MTQGDQFFDAMAEAIFARFQRVQGIRKRLFNAEEAAGYLGLSEDAVRDLVAQGRLKTARPTRKLQFDVFDLDKLVEDSKREAAA
jgi:excisionase family DNA binding protein